MKTKGRTFRFAIKFKNQRERKRFQKAAAILAGISGLLTLTWVGTRGSQPVPEVPVAQAPAPATTAPLSVAPKVQKPRAKPRNALRETARERARIGQRLHEFGLKREFFAARGVAGQVGALVSEKDLESASERSTFATVVTSDHSQHMVAYSKLEGGCAELAHLRGRAALKVDGEGKVIDGAYLPDTSPIPRSVIGCKVGRPAELADNSDSADPKALVFVTIYTPSYRHN